MAEFDFDELLGIAKEAGFTTVPPGTYHVEVERSEYTLTKNDKPMFKVMYRLIPGMNGEVKGTVWNNFVISRESAPALSFFFRHMEAMGLPKSWFQTAKPTMEQVRDALLGRQCRIKVEMGSFNDEPRPEVKSVLAPVGGPGAGSPPPAAGPGPAPSAGPGPAPAASPAPVGVNGGTAAPGPAPAAAPAAAQPAAQPSVPAAPAAPDSF